MSVAEITALKKTFRPSFLKKENLVLDGLNFSLNKGETVGFLGKNGSGKTTTINCMLGLTFADSGVVRLFEETKLSNRVKRKIGFLPEGPYFYPFLTGFEILEFYAKLSLNIKSKDIFQRVNSLLKKLDLFLAKDKVLRSYSKGMLQRVGLAQAFIHQPKLVVLDEPFAGLDPFGRKCLTELIKEASLAGSCVFLSSHQLNEVERTCDKIIALKSGRIAYEGMTVQFLNNTSRIRIVYKSEGEVQTVTCVEGEELQKMIDRLRGQGSFILEISKDKVSLEEAFMQLEDCQAKRLR